MNNPEKDNPNKRMESFRPLKISGIKFPENHIKTANWLHVSLFVILGIIIVISVGSVFNPHFLWMHFELKNFQLHSTVEALGAIAAILVAFMPLQALFGESKPSFVFLSSGFLVMGMWDMFHSFYSIGNGFVFTHSSALLGGGFLFSLFVFPWKSGVLKLKKYLMLLFGLLTATLAVLASLNRELFPEMVQDGIFTKTANNINFIAGLFFLISSVKLLVIYFRERNLGVLILVFTTISSAVVGITFQYSAAWSDGWWLWHFIRLIAFIAVLTYLLWRVQALSKERIQALQNIKNKHNQLIESEELFRIIFENSPLGKSRTGLDGSLNINKAFSEITGYNLEELQKKHWKEFTHPDDIKESEEAIQAMIDGKISNARFEKRYLHKEGHYVWTEVNTSLHRNEAGEPKFFITAITDISKRKEAEDFIKESEKKFKGLFENDPSAIIIADPQTGLLVDVNPAAEKLMEMSRQELIGLHQSKLHPEDVMEEQVEKFKKLQDNPNVKVDSEVLTKTGTRKPVEINVSMVEIKNKPYILGIFHDISNLVEQQKQLKQSEEKHRAIFESATDAFLIVNMQGEIVEANPTACQIYGYNYDEMIGMEVPSIIHPDYHPKFNEFMKDIQEKGMYSGETVDLRKDGSTFQTEVNGTIINFNNEPHMLGIIRDVTDKKEWENELKLKNIVFESSIAANSTADLAGNLTSVNTSFLNIWGYQNKKEVLGEPISKFIKYEKEADEILKGLSTDEKWSGNYTALKKDNSSFIAEANATVLYNSDGEKIGYQSSVFDVTEQKIAEEKVHREKRFNDSVINALPGVFYFFNKNGKLLKWNNQFAELAGFTQEEAAKKSPLDFIAEHHRDKIAKAIQTTFKTGEVMVQADFNAKGDSSIPYLFSGKIIQQNNEPLLAGIGIDITKRIEAEQELEKAMHDLNERMKEISCLFEINEAIKNPKISIPEVMDNITQSIPKGWQYPKKTCARVVLEKQEFKSKNFKESKIFIEQPLIVDDKKRGLIQVFVFDLPQEQEKSPFLKEEKQLLSTIANNVGIYINRVESAKELNKAMEKLQLSNKELERFAYVASHDLQEPLRMVSSYTQLLERRYKGKLDERADKYIYYAVDGANRMQNLINDLLDFSRVSTRGEKFEPFDTSEVLKNVMNSLSLRIEETGADIKIDSLPEIKGDKAQIERVFLNLIANAIKFRKSDKKPIILIDAKSRKNKWLFTVKDNGIGIDEKFQEKVFVIFQRLHGGNQYKGTGIGLAICKRIVQRHGGDIWFESEEGKGTTFFFTLKK